MQQPIIGVNLPEVALEALPATLEALAQDGFDALEYCLSDHPLIISGEIKWEYVRHVQDILRRYPFRYTAHIGNGLNLRSAEAFALHKQVLMASIQLCAEMGLSPLTLHFEEASPHLPVEEAFFEAHIEAADLAQHLGVALVIENIEVEHYGKVLDMLRRANHPNLNMTLDIGHLFLASQYFGHPYLEAVKECAPFVRHLHLSDNTGIFEPMRIQNQNLYNTLPLSYRFTFGRGDIHLPPFWGTIPIQEVLATVCDAGYGGIFLCEYYNELFGPFNRATQEKVRAAVLRAQGAGAS